MASSNQGLSEKDAQTKQRIITHMNRDHQDSLVRYVRHFGGVGWLAAEDARMTDLSLSSFDLTCRGKRYQVPLRPPMTSWAQARERAVELDREARQALGHSDVTVKTFVPPTGAWALGTLFCLVGYVAFSQRWWFAPGAVVERTLGARFAAFNYRLQPWLLPSTVAVHVLEALVFGLVKLPKHSVSPTSATFWLWISDVLFEGVFSTKRFDAIVKSQREKQKH